MSNFPGQFFPVPNSFQAIAVTNGAAVSLTLTKATDGMPKYALIQVLGANVNWRDDGVAPTAALGGGMGLPASSSPEGFAGNLSTAQFISTSASGSTLMISYYS
jgi:hypothetical protein